jgi:hypothetical protein
LVEVRQFVSVELIRDGGSFALKFEGRDGNEYIVFTKIRFADVGPEKKDKRGYHQGKEVKSYDQPLLIDCNPAKRPQDTGHIIYSELCEPTNRISWHQAREIMSVAGALAQNLRPLQVGWLEKMKAVIENEGVPPPGWERLSTWTQPL